MIDKNIIRLDSKAYSTTLEQVNAFTNSYLWQRIVELLNVYNDSVVGKNYPKIYLHVCKDIAENSAKVVLCVDKNKDSKIKVLRKRIGEAIMNLGEKIRG